MIGYDMDAPSWKALGPNWPNRETSRFMDVGDMRWHVQEAGIGPVLLLVHGTAAATHSWRDLLPLLAQRFRVLAIDLPGHGFTSRPPFQRPTLPRVAELLETLLARLDVAPDFICGHSAGAAIALRMVLDNRVAPKGIVSLNGALKPFPGMAGQIFPSMAKMLFVNPFAPRLFALGGRDLARVKRLIEGTGSRIDARGLDLYRDLMSTPGHIDGALAMMANWDLERFQDDIGAIDVPLLLLAGSNDKAVPPRDARALAASLRNATHLEISGLGHLMHEEQPEQFAKFISEFADETA